MVLTSLPSGIFDELMNLARLVVSGNNTVACDDLMFHVDAPVECTEPGLLSEGRAGVGFLGCVFPFGV